MPPSQGFIPRLKDFVLERLYGHDFDGGEREFTDEERNNVLIINDRIYQHKVIRINYTTYDMRRAQDSLNPRTHSDIMLLSNENDGLESHPFWYARIVGVFHAEVCHTVNKPGIATPMREPFRVDFLWVRWYGRELSFRAGWSERRLHRIGFVEDHEETPAFGFVHPSQVLRGAHLIPAFAHGRTKDLLPPSVIRPVIDNDEDWKFFYVNS